MFKWMNSMRAISTFLIVLAVIVGFLIGKLSEINFIQVVTVIVSAYFIKRDENKAK